MNLPPKRFEFVLLPLAAAAVVLLVLADPSLAQAAGETAELRGWFEEVVGKIRSPWFWFGMTAQFVFFMRFVVQWIASERSHRSTVPIAFWYLSVIGSLALFVYAAQQRDPVIMAGQSLACLIYVRNLMLISDFKRRRRQAGLPVTEVDPGEPGADTEVATGKPVR